jgi:hypothetical protein
VLQNFCIYASCSECWCSWSNFFPVVYRTKHNTYSHKQLWLYVLCFVLWSVNNGEELLKDCTCQSSFKNVKRSRQTCLWQCIVFCSLSLYALFSGSIP